MSRPAWFNTVIERLSKHPEYERRIIYLREEISCLYTEGNLAVDKQEELKELENEIYLIDVAIRQLSKDKQLLIKEKYIQENKDTYVLRLLNKNYGVKSKNKYYSLRDEAIEELAGMFGYLKGE
jgi:hypothetical protein